jgi:hypothetical protein
MLSEELIRIAVLWHEIWHEGLEEASRLFFGDHNSQAMFAVIDDLYSCLQKVRLPTAPSPAPSRSPREMDDRNGNILAEGLYRLTIDEPHGRHDVFDARSVQSMDMWWTGSLTCNRSIHEFPRLSFPPPCSTHRV